MIYKIESNEEDRILAISPNIANEKFRGTVYIQVADSKTGRVLGLNINQTQLRELANNLIEVEGELDRAGLLEN